MKRKHRMPRTAAHAGRASDLSPDEQADVAVIAAHGAYVRGLARREALSVEPGRYWPTLMVTISLEEIRLLLAELPADATPERLQPLRDELEEAYKLGVVGAGNGARV